jgi:hypothetical protein
MPLFRAEALVVVRDQDDVAFRSAPGAGQGPPERLGSPRRYLSVVMLGLELRHSHLTTTTSARLDFGPGCVADQEPRGSGPAPSSRPGPRYSRYGAWTVSGLLVAETLPAASYAFTV